MSRKQIAESNNTQDLSRREKIKEAIALPLISFLALGGVYLVLWFLAWGMGTPVMNAHYLTAGCIALCVLVIVVVVKMCQWRRRYYVPEPCFLDVLDDCHEDGIAAYQRGEPIDMNPYRAIMNSDDDYEGGLRFQADAWDEGWKEASTK